MKCRKQIVLTGYRVQFVDIRELKPRTPKEDVYVADRQWLDVMNYLELNVSDVIKTRYEQRGYKVLGIEPIKPKRVVELDLCQLWESAEPPATEAQAGEEVQRND